MPSAASWSGSVNLVIVGTAYPLRGGIAQYTALLSRALSGRGHHVRVLSFKRQYPSFLFPGKTQRDEGRPLVPVRAEALLDSVSPLTWIRAFFRLKKMRPGAVIFQYWMPFFAPCYAALSFLSKRFLGARILTLCHNILPHEKKPADTLLTRLGLRFSDRFIVQSGQVQEELLTVRPGAAYLKIPHPVYEFFPPAMPKRKARDLLSVRETRVMLFFGYIRAYKGLRHLLAAMPSILKRMRVRLLVCGEIYEGRDELFGLADRPGIRDRVSFHDRFIPNEDVAAFFCASDVVVLPYESATQSGIVQVAYHYDRPVIVTSVGGLPEMVPDGRTGFVVPPRDPEAIADAVMRFYSEKREAAFSRNIRIEKRKYSWDRMAEAVEALAC